MNEIKITVLIVSCASLFALCLAEAQQPAKSPAIGFLDNWLRLPVTRSASRRSGKGLRELGYVEGKNIIIE